MFRSLKKKAEAALHGRKSPKTLNSPATTDPNTSIKSQSREPSIQTEQSIVPSETEASQLRFQEEPEPEPKPEEEQDCDPYTPRYVPFTEASVAKSSMIGSSTSRYGRVNPAIMEGFGGNDESIWLVDDEETDEEAKAATRGATEPDAPDSNPHMDQPGPSDEQSSHRRFRYQTNSDLLKDDFTTTAPTSTASLLPEIQTPPEQTTAAKQPGYGPISSSILAGFDSGDEHETPPLPATQVEGAWSDDSTSTNPFVALCEQQDLAMTVAYLRRLDQCGDNGDELADDFSFGQRYSKAADTADIVVTHQRTPAEHLSGEHDCAICMETKEVALFPRFSLTATCKHPPSTCLDCVSMSIKCDLNNRLWTEIRCPECKELLEYVDIQRFADAVTFLRYETLALRAAMSQAVNFIWCTSGCGSGQIHESGREQPIVTCLHCHHRSCFQHNVPWHESLSCDEYDRLLADPENFRSRIEMENEGLSQAQRAQVDADRAMAQGLLAEDQAEARRREQRCREERERANKAAALARRIIARRQREERQSRETVSKTTRPCPGCGWAIEKNEGCGPRAAARRRLTPAAGTRLEQSVADRLAGTRCRHEFCYECGADHRQILARDNSAHKESCRLHPSQMPDDGDGGDVPDSD
ncbi:Uncharacterized protein TPAR_00897 [Tolypocladium paradoxum]|uniref:RBR-type E3 ubiquitin transferase n=1 Tax=Tolypocladium paradoxum TaxID=94208 RepID=A0A2S4L932_9HYPO|nr:Uncharacterized protein TPAR_00897 [Tolypocladium paradoxum]